MAYYYVEYDTVLAFLSCANQNYCHVPGGALDILANVRTKYADDPILMSIVANGEGICSQLDSAANAPAVSSTAEKVQPIPMLGGQYSFDCQNFVNSIPAILTFSLKPGMIHK